jgi:peptide/nickel transport system substrate-binding protein
VVNPSARGGSVPGRSPLPHLLPALLLAACARTEPPATPSELVVAFPAVPASLLSHRSTDEFSASVLRNAYEPLVDLDADLGLVPCLAESWHNPDPTAWSFRLRRDIRFHDGRRLEAAHVVAHLRRALEDPRARRSFRIEIRSIEAPDPQTVVIRTNRVLGPAPHGYFSSMLIALEPADPSQPLLGTGPYRVRSFEPRQRVALEAFEGYRRGPPPIRRVEFKAVADEEARARVVRTGQAHLAIDVPASATAPPGVRTLARKGLRVTHLRFNAFAPPAGGAPNPLRDRRVRQAIAQAIDRPALVSGPLAGQADLIEELVPPEVFGHHGRFAPLAFDPEGARRLLAAAGFRGGLDLTLDYVTGRYRGMDQVAAAVASDLRAVGIEAALRPASLAAFRQQVSERKETALFLVNWLSATGDAGAVLSVLVHSPAGRERGLYSAYSNPAVDRLIDESYGPVAADQRRELLKSAAELVRKDVAVVPLYRQWDLYAVSAGLDFTPRLDRRIRAFEVRWRPPER